MFTKQVLSRVFARSRAFQTGSFVFRKPVYDPRRLLRRLGLAEAVSEAVLADSEVLEAGPLRDLGFRGVRVSPGSGALSLVSLLL